MDALRRPASLDPHELGFTPRRAVPWLAPLLLSRTGLRTVLATLFGAYLDKRELQGVLPARTFTQPGTDGELWLDYVADLGDGFDATYSVAYLLGQPRLTVGGRELPRGQMLLLGGDQVYPTASAQNYEDRFKGPYTAALPIPPADGPQPTLYALPGNHDWYDGLTAFLRLFAGERTDHIGGWRTEQSRSYFAVELPHSWWLYAVDEASGTYLDDPQLVYFERAARQLNPGDRVVLVVPEPSWVDGQDEPDRYAPVDFFIRTVIAPTGAEVKLMISGNSHHYARYSNPDRQLVTCGGGGAYLSATHLLPERIVVPPAGALARRSAPKQEYALAGSFPERARSRRLSWGVFGRLRSRNPNFTWLVGGLHLLLMLAIVGAVDRMGGTDQELVSIPLAVMILVVLGAAVGFACIPTGGSRTVRHLVAGLAHGVVQLGLGAAGAWAWLRLPFAEWAWPLPLLLAALLYLPVAGLVAGELVAGYLLVASWFRVNVNELFAGQGIEDAKSFLRLHITRDGALTIYPIAVDRVCRRWRANPDPDRPEAPWIVPARTGPVPHLAEDPITID